MRGEIEREPMKRVILRVVPDSGGMRLGELNAIPRLTIVVPLCVYYPCQDAGAQRALLRGRNFSQQCVQNDFEELYRSLLKRKGLEIAAE
jgi:hypothetical protein